MTMRTFSTTALIALSVALGGCGMSKPTLNQGLESVHQPVVSRTDYVIDVAAGGNGLASGERERLIGWFDSMRLAYGDRVSIDDRDPYGNAGAREAIAATAGRYGLLLSDSAPVTAGEVPAGSVRVIVSRSRAEVPGCPDWSRGSTELVGSAMSNYGCAVNSNLAAMIANPEDLIHGRDPVAGTDVDTAGKAIKSYRTRQPSGEKELTKETTGKGSN